MFIESLLTTRAKYRTVLAAIVVLTMTASSARAGAIAHWTFDNDFTESIGVDITSTTATGTPSINTLDSKFGGGSLDTSGSDYLTTNGWAMGGSFTVSVWYQPHDINANWVGILSKNLGGNTFWIGQHGGGGRDGDIRFGNYFNGSAEVALDTTSKPLVNNTWIHIATVWDEVTDTQTIYVNGVVDSSIVRAGQTQAVGNSAMNIGRSSCCTTDGLIDEAWIFDEALGQTEIQNLMNTNTLVPEPSTISLMILGALGLLALGRRRKK